MVTVMLVVTQAEHILQMIAMVTASSVAGVAGNPADFGISE